jgi:hypothetical protein
MSGSFSFGTGLDSTAGSPEEEAMKKDGKVEV